LKPSALTEAGYRLYDEDALKRLHCIMLFRELRFSLREIAKIIDSPGFEKRKAPEQQLRLLKLKRERIDNIISAVNKMIITEGKTWTFRHSIQA
jgi:DNA-binding transcriptional MerR regulator